jgi:hypothetical protein
MKAMSSRFGAESVNSMQGLVISFIFTWRLSGQEIYREDLFSKSFEFFLTEKKSHFSF